MLSNRVAANDLPTELTGVQILRGIAASLVVFHHALEEAQYVRYSGAPPDWLVRFGAAGVDIFFVISGFIMMWVNFAPHRVPQKPASFLIKRMLRIYPLYWVCCAIGLALKAAGFFRSLELEPAWLVNSLLLLPFSDSLLIGVAWTLVYELFFYGLFAVSLSIGKPLASLLLTTSLIAVCNLASRLLPDSSLSAFLSSEIVFEFCFGLAIGYIATQKRVPRFVRYAGVLGALLLVALSTQIIAPTTSGRDNDLERLFVWGIPAALIVLSAVYWMPSPTRIARFGRALGDASFALYLTQGFIMVAYAVILRRVPAVATISQWPVVFCVVAAACMLGLLAHRTVERAVNQAARSITPFSESEAASASQRP